jgi:hypothetical protein
MSTFDAKKDYTAELKVTLAGYSIVVSKLV